MEIMAMRIEALTFGACKCFSTEFMNIQTNLKNLSKRVVDFFVNLNEMDAYFSLIHTYRKAKKTIISLISFQFRSRDINHTS